MSEFVHKVTLSTGKVVLMREPKIKHQELAALAVGRKHENAPLAQQTAVQTELVKLLLAEVDGVPFKSHDDLDNVVTYAEFQQVLKATAQIMGGGEDGAVPLKLEVVSSGGKSHGSPATLP